MLLLLKRLINEYRLQNQEAGDAPAPTGGAAPPVIHNASAGDRAVPGSETDPDKAKAAANKVLADAAARMRGDVPPPPPGAKQPDETKPGEEGDKPEDGEEGDKPEEVEAAEAEEVPEPEELTEEDKAYIEESKARYQQRLAEEATFQTWSTVLDPSAKAYFDQQRQARLERLQGQANQPTQPQVDPVTGQPVEQPTPAQPTGDQPMVPLRFDKPFRSFKNLETTERYEPPIVDAEWFKRHGVDPMSVPAQYAKLFNELVKDRNRIAADAAYLHKEGRKAYGDRDNYKNEVLKSEMIAAMQTHGYEVTEEARALFPDVRKNLYRNGQQRPWHAVLEEASQAWPKAFSKADAQALVNKVNTQAAAADAKPKPREGTKTSSASTPQPAPNAKKPLPKGATWEERKAAFLEDAKRRRG